MRPVVPRMLGVRARTLRYVFRCGGALLCVRRGCCQNPGGGGPTSSVVPPSTVELQDALDMDGEITLNVYRPYGEQDTPHRDATRRFLYTIITTTDEQEWKDMLAAAIRLNTWREHHLRAVLRSVHQTQYDIGGAQGGREAAQAGGCTPATRFQRALGVMQTAVDEGYAPAPESVHALLVVILRAALPGAESSVAETTFKEPQQHLLLVPRAAVWQFLAWMERHNYHVMSTAVLEDLERVIEDDTQEGMNGGRTGGVRQNRLEYLQRERDGLLGGHKSSSKRGGNRREVRPVTVPDDGCK
ncbi:putative heat shock protein-like protein [Trypanosoma rangeli]|uniref:Putative heat shock protein-like protein n=1 Tax=Trypanosoma rangeli TaxID=5698 RepID=A0A3R7MTX4_TRYRA|nr:putative heat shock protein-like protein [Trypanosoma rangeli]RNF08064.1 putative heat shock protein-like protein [Trypanosoma rangeli]|eukprot:RNF08064.1 putative heat shock protein-like protein [Trypanosoma rangeli]